MPETEFCENVATENSDVTTTENDVAHALSTKMAELEVMKAVILEQKNGEIQVARDKYADALAEINKKQVALRRMIKTSEKL
jgi:hypothetical protein